jgi:hypothetical protein
MSKKIYKGSNWFNEERAGSVDDDGNINEGSNWFTEEKVGRVDDDGNLHEGSNWFTEEKAGRIDDDGNIYEGSNWFTEEKVGRIDDDGNIYKGSNWFTEEKVGRVEDDDDSGCFLTTAYVKYAGLTDDCSELQTLRHFRDSYVSNLPDGNEMLGEYYRNAPRIISKFIGTEKETQVLSGIYSNIRKAVTLIHSGKNCEALKCYKGMYQDLLERFGKQ